MSDPNFAEVAAKTVDHITGGVKAIADAAQKVAPHAWEVAVRQQKIEASITLAECLMVALAFIAAAVVLFRQRGGLVRASQLENKRRYPTLYRDQKPDEIDATVTNALVFSGVGLALFLASVGIANAGQAAVQICNPEYYAAKALLEAVK